MRRRRLTKMLHWLLAIVFVVQPVLVAPVFALSSTVDDEHCMERSGEPRSAVGDSGHRMHADAQQHTSSASMAGGHSCCDDPSPALHSGSCGCDGCDHCPLMSGGFADLTQPILLTQIYLAVESASEVVGEADPVFPQVPLRPPRG